MDTRANQFEDGGLAALGIELAAFANNLPGGFFVYEAHDDKRILYANEYMPRLFGCDTVDEFMEYVGGTFSGLVYHEDRQRVEDSVWAQIDSVPKDDAVLRDHVSYRIVDKSGALRYLDEYGRLIRGTARGDVFFVFVASVFTYEGAVGGSTVPPHHAVSAGVDVLTGLPSMPYYHGHTSEFLSRAFARGIPMVDVFFDVDHFRTINFRLGYEGGDEVLQRVGNVLQEVFPGDLLSRFSDDHFVLVTRRQGLEERLELAHDRVARILPGMNVELKAGVFELSPGETTIPFAHDRAKVACNSIKGRYDRHYRFYDQSLSIEEELRNYVVENIETAVASGWIHNYYQPVVRAQTERTCGVEALSRWIDPDRGMLSPVEFISVLEESRLIHLLDQAVIDRACEDLQRMRREHGVAVPVSLNFAPTALSLFDVPAMLDKKLREHDIEPELVHVEITESSLAEDPELLRSVIARLHRMGYKVWMDDFGSGYSSLNLLKDYDFDVLKVDMEFLRGMEGNDKSRTIVSAVTNLAHELNMTTLVEGVETRAQFEFLRSVGVDRAQGFLFSRPVPYDELVNDFFRRYPPE
ncbi:MAG: EAL domain-containing protein [Atopobiaceae bacterium]|nr:EAL domain-containing protein [Atopobiaceae bacterium]